MATLKNLKIEAMESCDFRGHSMGAWADGADATTSQCQCAICDAWVVVETNPMPNGIDIGGSAVALGCEDCIQRVYKTFNDSLPGGKHVKLEAMSVGVYTDSQGTKWTVYKPVSVEWHGMYHLVPVNGGEPWLPTDLGERRIIAAWEDSISQSQ